VLVLEIAGGEVPHSIFLHRMTQWLRETPIFQYGSRNPEKFRRTVQYRYRREYWNTEHVCKSIATIYVYTTSKMQ
jgi:hypothetical protein